MGLTACTGCREQHWASMQSWALPCHGASVPVPVPAPVPVPHLLRHQVRPAYDELWVPLLLQLLPVCLVRLQPVENLQARWWCRPMNTIILAPVGTECAQEMGGVRELYSCRSTGTCQLVQTLVPCRSMQAMPGHMDVLTWNGSNLSRMFWMEVKGVCTSVLHRRLASALS